jgi:hypothetical protein
VLNPKFKCQIPNPKLFWIWAASIVITNDDDNIANILIINNEDENINDKIFNNI